MCGYRLYRHAVERAGLVYLREGCNFMSTKNNCSSTIALCSYQLESDAPDTMLARSLWNAKRFRILSPLTRAAWPSAIIGSRFDMCG